MQHNVSHLPRELSRMIFWSLTRLGKAIDEVYGKETFERIEQIRLSMQETIGSEALVLRNALLRLQTELSKLDRNQLYQIAHGFSLMLELINACENAYRIFRINQRQEIVYSDKPQAIHYVLTAHPTEARTPEFLTLFKAITDYLCEVLKSPYLMNEAHLDLMLKTSLQINISYQKKPSVEEEAQYIYQYALSPLNIKLYHHFLTKGIPIQLRSWVGGDKDGHSGVNEKIMVRCLELSRSFFIASIQDGLKEILEIIKLSTALNENKPLTNQITQLIKRGHDLRKIKPGDHEKVTAFTKELMDTQRNTLKFLNFNPEQFSMISSIFRLYPALVIPIELREDSAVVKTSLKSIEKTTITKMLEQVYSITRGTNPKNYVRGFILSMVESAEDIKNGISLVKKIFRNYALPVVPLFENQLALTSANTILSQSLTEDVRQKHLKLWDGYYEVMLGYSDSSKENGVLPSRLMIAKSLKNIQSTLENKNLRPIFFHGSGGSIERGGGDIKEQTASWSKDMMTHYKATVQGEMVARLFGSSSILKSQIDKFLAIYSEKNNDSDKGYPEELLSFAHTVSQKYKALINSEWFWPTIESASPYHFLTELKIGSRPTKRKSGPDQRKLRAIPWILCWTQTRILFPTWWGIGSTWLELDALGKNKLKMIYNENSLFAAFVKQLGVTLSKVYLPIWEQYLCQLTGSDEYLTPFQSELESTILFFHQITGENDFCFHQPWLGESIQLRSTLVHPLNLIQIEAMKRIDLPLLRKTVTGISCGMLTTG
ncbi:phosphoenolpyruvate carboxylase [Fluoribacter dumoffii]|uniref:phosphoenolpyruvate carboxylase n=1 Tax=Fluoribacter dumoffii TaxID=463 RepID=UPI002243C4A9|nr:phosphoenolpyruvate carboxylase [Fluoribacter dumoffii]MCW8385434.1 phosphoenolpyruvate carboxylase [Fluoribacter dumoffii]MCW8418487.1 phosphoenolpyruvate carboxylase [Fluoribacter dumoffii]MCW8453671.1 phosphoenolpyruvate carboxylase [Fluoribacter dumoffii]MCW8459111.1 phosphoenolpyruvate carboxylase [Fluoribacter dumoffii]MCW8482470.1 phosphoenolpyruvate carboxylase [Fluoribacter dumoffii]